jgi:hypothetical protein
MKPYVRLIMAMFLVTAMVRADEERTWTGKNGDTFRAEFVALDGDFVTIRREPDAAIVGVPRSNLSAADLAYADKTPPEKDLIVKVEGTRARFYSKTTGMKPKPSRTSIGGMTSRC